VVHSVPEVQRLVHNKDHCRPSGRVVQCNSDRRYRDVLDRLVLIRERRHVDLGIGELQDNCVATHHARVGVRIKLRPARTAYGLGDLAPVDLPIRLRSARNCSNSPLLGVGVVVGNGDINVSAVVAVELSVALLVCVLAEVVTGVLVWFLFFSRFNGRGFPLLLGSFFA
jgi:hypothetical protein